jgi:excisionase family DNA binding protein
VEYTIQEVSEILGIPIQKLRRWDEQKVLVAGRTDGGHRRYSRELIDRLTEIGATGDSDKATKELATIRKSLAEKRRIIQLLLESENPSAWRRRSSSAAASSTSRREHRISRTGASWRP